MQHIGHHLLNLPLDGAFGYGFNSLVEEIMFGVVDGECEVVHFNVDVLDFEHGMRVRSVAIKGDDGLDSSGQAKIVSWETQITI